jgi:hypothetical protein
MFVIEGGIRNPLHNRHGHAASSVVKLFSQTVSGHLLSRMAATDLTVDPADEPNLLVQRWWKY